MLPFLVLLLLGVALLLVVMVSMLAAMHRRLRRLEASQHQVEVRLLAVEQSRTAREQRPARGELSIGDPMPAFDALTPRGDRVSAEALCGQRVLLVHWAAACPFCSQLIPELRALAPRLLERGVTVVLVTPDAALTRHRMAAYGLECLVVSEEKEEYVGFVGRGTPVAYLVDATARVERPLAVGMQQVAALLRDTAGERPVRRSLDTSRLRRDGLKVGERVSSLTLPEVRGGTVRLDDYLGRRLLVVFTDPRCGPCQALMPELVRRHDDLNDVAVLLIGRGDPEANRAEAAAHGHKFPVALQRRWEVSLQFGIFFTPVAFLIGPDGVVERPVAKGAADILRMVDELRSPGTVEAVP
jgi:peroxiredoxin